MPSEERAKEVKDLESDAMLVERALDVQWCVQSDAIKFKITLKNLLLPKRGILSIVSSVYDPLGFQLSSLLRKSSNLCRRRLGWENPLPTLVAREWMTWLDDL